MSRHAVVLFNLGGPDAPGSVRPFLFNLFNDPAIIGAPGPIRWLLAAWVAWRRAPTARQIYDRLGGASPLLEMTRQQAGALQSRLDREPGDDTYRVFIAMRYWHPMSEKTAAEVRDFEPDSVVLLPLYPQFSTTTTGSSFAAWKSAATKAGLSVQTRALCCYPTAAGVVAGQAGLVGAAIAAAAKAGTPRVLFSAHGLPEKIVAAGDPYAWQIEQTAASVAAAVEAADWAVCYQSRVGPLKWIGPSIEDELRRAAADRVPVVVVPIAFVSEHSETLVELDVEYAALADDLGLPAYVRVPALGVEAPFIEGLAESVEQALARPAGRCDRDSGRLCPDGFGRCLYGTAA
jgi:protoporphyrin/coproporphyrin ferrochelatase